MSFIWNDSNGDDNDNEVNTKMEKKKDTYIQEWRKIELVLMANDDDDPANVMI